MSIIIREAELKDCGELMAIRQMPKVMENILSYENEPKDFIEKRFKCKSEGDYWFVAEKNDKVIGLIILNNHLNPRKCHVGGITVMVNSDYHNMGVGTMLMNKVVELADSKLNIKRLELGVFTENQAAIKLYKKFNFEVEGIKRKSALRNDQFADEYYMGRIKN
jgi:putative acetyltransferase